MSPAGSPSAPSPGPGFAPGQATVEVALLVPILVAFALVLVQVGLVLRDQVVVVHAAREAARAASVDPAPGAAQAAASRVLSGAVVRSGARPQPGGFLAVEVAYRSPTGVPVVGPLLPDPQLRAHAVMRVER